MPEPRFWLRLLCISVLFLPATAFAQQQAPQQQGGGAVQQQQGIFLLEPIGPVGVIPTQGNEGLGVMGYYFGLLYPWVVGVGAGIAIFNGVIGGIQIIQSGSDASGVSNGKNRLLLSLLGLLIILGSVTIMNAINPVFFR